MTVDLSEYRACVEYGWPNSVADYVTRLITERNEAEASLARVIAERDEARKEADEERAATQHTYRAGYEHGKEEASDCEVGGSSRGPARPECVK